MPREREEGEHPLVVKVAALGAASEFVGPDAAVLGPGLTPTIEDVLGHFASGLTARRLQHVAETMADAAEELGGDAAEQLRQQVKAAAASDETCQELLARTLTIAQETRDLLG